MSDAPKWLQQLESKVQEAAKRLQALSKENAKLRDKVAGLEKELAAARKGAESAWSEERDQIRERVEALAGKLEELLTDASAYST